ncbi:type II toxin-antitoxin system HicB family antitoxin [Allochromatium humboldtianum]
MTFKAMVVSAKKIALSKRFRWPMKYKVALRKTDEGFSISCPGLPGCWSQGKTEQEALENIADAINEYVAVSAELAATADTEMREVEVAA